MKTKIKLGKRAGGKRLDLALSEAVPSISRSRIQKLIEAGQVVVNGQVAVSIKRQVEGEETIEITEPEPEEKALAPKAMEIDVIYEDHDLAVVNKPKGLTVHPGAGNGENTLASGLLFKFGEGLPLGGGIDRPGIVHRIDKDTGGLLLIAKTDRAYESLSKQLAAHTIKRVYNAIVYNNFKEDEGTLDIPIGRHPKNRTKKTVNGENPKRAITHYKVIERFGAYTHIELRLETGRTHQIRVHMAHINHCILGDGVYGPRKNEFGIRGQLLYAKTIGFIHPETGRYQEFDSELPEEFMGVIAKLRRRLGGS